VSGSVSEILRKALGTSQLDGKAPLVYMVGDTDGASLGESLYLYKVAGRGVFGVMVDAFVQPGVDAIPTYGSSNYTL